MAQKKTQLKNQKQIQVKQQSKTVQATTSLMSPKDVGISREAEEALTKSNRLQFLTLAQGSGDAVQKNEPDGVRAGDFILGKTKLLGDEVIVVPGISRARAMIWDEGKVVLETFDPQSEEWSRCKATKKGGNTGIEFLLWLPDEGTFSTFYFKNTAKEAGAGVARARDEGRLCKLTSRLIEGKENNWHVPVVESVDAEGQVTMPSEEEMAEAVASFESYKLEKKVAPDPAARPR